MRQAAQSLLRLVRLGSLGPTLERLEGMEREPEDHVGPAEALVEGLGHLPIFVDAVKGSAGEVLAETVEDHAQLELDRVGAVVAVGWVHVDPDAELIEILTERLSLLLSSHLLLHRQRLLLDLIRFCDGRALLLVPDPGQEPRGTRGRILRHTQVVLLGALLPNLFIFRSLLHRFDVLCRLDGELAGCHVLSCSRINFAPLALGRV
mmetsp:Transcript_11727/g.28448  ORF Transcript_11727/g.28448 Transcript_11727/m.28448 type:complete len:206 (-) Transcript_11727:330-947(-)